MPTQMILNRAVAERDLTQLLTRLPQEDRAVAAQAIVAWIFCEDTLKRKGRCMTTLALPYSPSRGGSAQGRRISLFVDNEPVIFIARDGNLVAITA